MYRFLRVEGIDNVNTPLFPDKDTQHEWFTNKEVAKVDDIFPPFYTNVIRVSNEELDFNSDVNYVELVFNNKSYYYFIENTNYIAEDLIDITLRMDTIQTYMFDIEYTNARVKRRTIKRWNDDGTINRDYIRENFGNDVMIDKSYIDYSKLLQFDGFSGWIVGKAIKDTIFGVANPSILRLNNKKYTDGSSIFILPAIMFNSELIDISTVQFEYYKNNSKIDPTIDFPRMLNILNDLQEDAKMIDLMYMPRETFKNLNIVYNNETDIIEIHFNDDFELKSNTAGTAYYLTTTNAELLQTSRIIDFNFFKNESANAFFSYMYCPQLLDENYIECQYGERINTTSYPLSKMTTTRLYGMNNNDVLTGSRNYWLVENEYGDDIYLTLKTINTKETYPMINDYWKQYMANNKGSFVIGNTLAMLKTGFDLYTLKQYKTPKGNPKQIHKSTGGLTAYGTQLKNATLDNETLDTVIDSTNKIFAPETLTQGNEVTNDVLSNALNEISIVREVSNIEYVATIYESIGYRVDDFITGSPIFNDRKYYNYVECDDMDIRLTCLSIENALEDIKNRYYNGIRYYNLQPLLNLETKLGEVCVYDNVEL